MNTTTYTTASGTEITLAIVQGALKLSVGGNAVSGGVQLVTDPQHGKCLKPYFGKMLVTVPSEALDSVESVVAECVKINARTDEQAAEESHQDTMHKVMGY